jgi:hypothetical protein
MDQGNGSGAGVPLVCRVHQPRRRYSRRSFCRRPPTCRTSCSEKNAHRARRSGAPTHAKSGNCRHASALEG